MEILFFFDIKFNLLDDVTSVGWDATEAMLSDLEMELKEYVQFRFLGLLLIFYCVVSNIFWLFLQPTVTQGMGMFITLQITVVQLPSMR